MIADLLKEARELASERPPQDRYGLIITGLADALVTAQSELSKAVVTNKVWRSHPSHGECQACEQYQAALEALL